MRIPSDRSRATVNTSRPRRPRREKPDHEAKRAQHLPVSGTVEGRKPTGLRHASAIRGNPSRSASVLSTSATLVAMVSTTVGVMKTACRK